MHHIPFAIKTLNYIDNKEVARSREQKLAIQSIEGDLHFGNDRQPGNN